MPFDGKSYSQKVFWYSPDYDRPKEPHPAVLVKSRRLDVSDSPTFRLEDGTNAILGDNRYAIVTGVILPTTGCWEISGQYHGTSLTFVVFLEP